MNKHNTDLIVYLEIHEANALLIIYLFIYLFILSFDTPSFLLAYFDDSYLL